MRGRVCIRLLLAFFVFSASHAAAEGGDSCTVVLTCDIDGLAVEADGRMVGVTPDVTLDLPPGEHTIRVLHPRPEEWMSGDWAETVTLVTGDSTMFDVRFGDRPAKARIGMTPAPTDSLRRFLLASAADGDASVMASPIQMPGGPSRNPRLRKGWVIGSAVLGLASGIAGYCFRRRADRSYDAYRRALHEDAMDRHFHDAERYDRVSGWCYAVGEVGLGVSLVLFVRGFSGR